MNYLGHAVLSPLDDLITLGNLSGDYLKNHMHPLLSPPILQGVFLHRSIDFYTDNHPDFRAMLTFYRPYFGKYSGVVLDVLLDYLLSKLWDQLFENDFTVFSSQIYEAIFDQSKSLPERPAEIMFRMASSDWLAAYGEEERILRVFKRLSEKAQTELSGSRVLDVLKENESTLIALSLDFFYDIKKHLKDNALLTESRVEWRLKI